MFEYEKCAIDNCFNKPLFWSDFFIFSVQPFGTINIMAFNRIIQTKKEEVILCNVTW